MQVKDIVPMEGALRKLLALALPVKTAWELRSLAKAFNEALENYKQVHHDLVVRYGMRNPDREGEIIVDPKKFMEFSAAEMELLAIEVPLPAVPKIKLALLGDTFSMLEMAQLEFLIEE